HDGDGDLDHDTPQRNQMLPVYLRTNACAKPSGLIAAAERRPTLARSGGFAERLVFGSTTFLAAPLGVPRARPPLTGLHRDVARIPGVALRSIPGYRRSPLRGYKNQTSCFASRRCASSLLGKPRSARTRSTSR